MGVRYGTYSIEDDGDRAVVRSLADQWPTLHRILTTVHASFEPIGAPHLELGRIAVIERDFWGRERHWPRSVLRDVTLEQRRLRGDEIKRPAIARPWRVSLRDGRGEPLRASFGFRQEADARGFRTELRRFLDLEQPAPTEPGAGELPDVAI